MSRRKLLVGAAALMLGGGAIGLHAIAGRLAGDGGRTSAEPSAGSERLDPDVAAARLASEKNPAARRKLIRALAAAPDAVARLRVAFDGSHDGAAREEALIQASKLGGPEAAAWLADVTGTSRELGGRAGAALGTMTSGKAAPELARITRSDGPVMVRANAAQALGRSGTKDHAADVLALAVASDQPLRVRQEAADALARIGDNSQVPKLAAALEAAVPDATFDGEQLRIGFVRALGGIGSPEAREVLLQHSKRELSRNERAFVETALARR